MRKRDKVMNAYINTSASDLAHQRDIITTHHAKVVGRLFVIGTPRLALRVSSLHNCHEKQRTVQTNRELQHAQTRQSHERLYTHQRL